jgi:AcrR family transcriptional regulator
LVKERNMLGSHRHQVFTMNSTRPLRGKESNTTTKGYERSAAILDAAYTILATEGYAALSMRSIAQRVGVSLSNVQHYYPSRDALIEALLEQTLTGYQAEMDRIAAGTESPQLRFSGVIDYFLETLRGQVQSGLFFEVAALANRHPVATTVFDAMLTRARKNLRRLIRDIAPAMPPAQCEIRAALVVSQLIGSMVFIADSRPRHEELAGLQQETAQAIQRIAFAA